MRTLVVEDEAALRHKLDPLDRIGPIETVYGADYRFAVARGPSGQAVTRRRPKSRCRGALCVDLGRGPMRRCPLPPTRFEVSALQPRPALSSGHGGVPAGTPP